ncbi:nucleotide-binding protein [Asticcacaulis solisilvae]|uniref:nucleotide-binding protein n=1 Tax=Asticcacaulis solisilvae TaxID=1217274 RepID=UPI003FD7DFAD
MTKVISVVSGKGGAGKSLLTAVLGRAVAREGSRVLLIDMDIFVRGLTVLLFGFGKPDKSRGKYTTSDLMGVFEKSSQDKRPLPTDSGKYLIQRFFECDVLPAVDNIGAPLDYDDENLSNEQFCRRQVSELVNSLQGEYDYIFLDNRAGMDSLVAATCYVADIVLSVAEDDDVGRQTNVNLVRFLHSRKYARVIYTIINKGRNIKVYEDVVDRSRYADEFSTLGIIPFDIEILDEFGSESFWSAVNSTLYFMAIIRVWNNLAKFEQTVNLSEKKYNFPPKVFMNPSQGRLTFPERMLRIYSILFIISGGIYWIYDQLRQGYHLEKMYPELIFIFGTLMLVLSTSGFQSFIRDSFNFADYRMRRSRYPRDT